MITSWVTVGGCEMFSDPRAAALTQRSDDLCIPADEYPGLPAYLCDDCDGLAEWLTTECGGELSVVANAPWYDPVRPETAGIRGIVALSFTGTGGILGSADDDPTSMTGRRREFELTWAVLANSQIAASAAVAWLADRLDDFSCATDCRGFDVCAFAGCPTDGDFEGALRTIPDVRLVSGPVIEQKDTLNAGTQIWQGSIIFETPSPYILHASPAAATLTLTAGNAEAATIDLNPDCEEAGPCGDDPDFPLPTLPDLDTGTVDPAWPQDPYPGSRKVFSIAPGVLQRSTVGLRLTVTSGELPVRYLAVRLWPNPAGLPCSSILSRPNADCDVCNLVVVKYMPPRSTTIIDAAKLFRQITCVDGSVGVPQMWGPDGGSFSWPLLHCGGGLCMEMSVQGTLGSRASVVAEFIPMDGAA